jgi:hypothetical protein
MKQPFLIPGEGFNASPFPQPPRPARSPRFVRVLVSVWVLGALVFLAIKLLPARPEPLPVPKAAPETTAISMEDLLRHMDVVNRKLAESAAKIRRVEDQIDRTVPSLDRNYLLVESQRLKNSAAIAEGARRDLEDIREEFQLVLNSLRKDDHQQ